MKTVKSGMITVCLIIIILVCQLSPIAPQTSDYFGGYDTLAGLQLVSNPLYTSVQAIDNSTAGHAFHKMPVRWFGDSIYRLETMQAYRFELYMRMPPMDTRSMIRENIPHYFNGSKYKVSCLFS